MYYVKGGTNLRLIKKFIDYRNCQFQNNKNLLCLCMYPFSVKHWIHLINLIKNPGVQLGIS